MATRRDELASWARADEILHPDERTRLGEFLDLFEEQLSIVAPNPTAPSVIERFAARKRAADLWAFDRLTSDGAVMRARVRDAASRQLGRAEHFAESDLKGRLAHLVFEQIEDADRLLRYGRHVSVADDDTNTGTVVELSPKRRRKA